MLVFGTDYVVSGRNSEAGPRWYGSAIGKLVKELLKSMNNIHDRATVESTDLLESAEAVDFIHRFPSSDNELQLYCLYRKEQLPLRNEKRHKYAFF